MSESDRALRREACGNGAGLRGTVYRCTFPNGGGRAVRALAIDINEAIVLMDPFQEKRR